MREMLDGLIAAARRLMARPALTIATVATLGLSIGATTAIFTVVDGVVLRPLPFANESRLVTVCEQFPGSTSGWCGISPPNVADIAERSRAIDAIGIGREWGFHLATASGADAIAGGLASPGMFRALGVKPVIGRLIDERDMLGRPSSVALLGYDAWQTRFGGDSAILGRVVTLDKDAVTIIGVLPQGFVAPRLSPIDIWRPLHFDPRDEKNRNWRGFVAYGRLRDGVSLELARRDLDGIAVQLRAEHFANIPWGLSMMTMRDLVIGSVRPVLMLFLGAVGLVLLIGCANVMNLLLVRSSARRRELALRAALGAARYRLIGSLFAESVILAVVGGASGVALAFGAVRVFKILAPQNLPRIDEVHVNGGVLVFALILSLATALLFGTLPALRGSRVDLGSALREGGRSGTGHRSPLASGLVMGEIALAIVVVAGAGLLGRDFVALSGWRPGFDRENIQLFTLAPPTSRYDSHEKIAALWDRVESELSSIPGVVRVGSASAGPLFGGDGTHEIELSGYDPNDRKPVAWFDVSPGFFAALGVPIVKGRTFDARDAIGAPLTVLVNESLVRRYWSKTNPIGQRIRFPVGTDGLDLEVIGVVRDVPPITPGAPTEPEIYWSNRQQPRPYSYFIVRTADPQTSIAATIRSRMRAIDRDLAVTTVRSMNDVVDRKVAAPRFNFLLIGAFAIVALVLAAVGTYALLSSLVAQRTREIGIRMALGASASRVRREVMARGLALAAWGTIVGLLGVLALGGVVSSLVPGISPRDPLTLIATPLVIVAVAAFACAWPAWRASRVDPAVVLAAE